MIDPILALEYVPAIHKVKYFVHPPQCFLPSSRVARNTWLALQEIPDRAAMRPCQQRDVPNADIRAFLCTRLRPVVRPLSDATAEFQAQFIAADVQRPLSLAARSGGDGHFMPLKITIAEGNFAPSPAP